MDQSEEDSENTASPSNEEGTSGRAAEPPRRRSRILHSLRSLIQRSVSEVEVELNGSSDEPMSSSEDDIEAENRLFEEYLQQHDGPTEEFNTELPAEHAYLGQMDAVTGLDYFEPNKVFRIQIFEHHSFVFPGETLPMIWSDTQFDRAEYSSEGFTFGLVFWDPTFKKKVGVTCQVYERGVDAHGNITLKCRAHQRFVVVKQQNGSFLLPGAPYSRRRCLADVKIQPEIELVNPLQMMMSNSLKAFSVNSTSAKKINTVTAATTRWPKFVYDQVDVNRVLRKVERFLAMLKIETAPTDLVKLSFWLARNVPISEQRRYEIFITNNVTQRLLIISKALDIMCYFCCKRCKNQLANYNEIFAMSKQGVQSNYCNPSGYIHETLTVYNMVEGSSYLVDRPSTDFSWFPGYAWQILLCNNCQVHIGWKFIATKKNLVPRTFFGLSGKSLIVEKAKNLTTSSMESTDEAEEETSDSD